MTIPVWYRGETKVLKLTVVDGTGALVDLRDVDGIEFQAKRHLDDLDPPLVSKALGSGIVIRDQDVEPGVADVTIDSDDWNGVTAGHVWADVVLIFNASPPIRLFAIRPTYYKLSGVVNPP